MMAGPSTRQCVDFQATVGKTLNMNEYAKVITHVNLEETFVLQMYIDGEKINCMTCTDTLCTLRGKCFVL